MVRWPPRPIAKMSARRPSGKGISSSTEYPAWRISRQAPRHTARVTSGRAWRAWATGSMALLFQRGRQPRRTRAARPLGLGDELVGQRLGARAVALGELLAGFLARRLAVGVAAALGQHQPLVAFDGIGCAGGTGGQEQAERLLRIGHALGRGAHVPLLCLLRIARHADAR